MRKKNTYKKPTAFQLKPVCAALLIAFGSPQAISNPMGGVVVNGQANMATVGNTLTVTNTPGTIINWQGFSIGANEVTRFIQQSASSAVLNRVIGNNPSNILGTLQSNGRVFLINPNGIVFGAGSVVDVAGLVASTLNMSNADFLAGRYNFTKVPGAQNISNAGNLNAQQGGQIFLIAPNVDNSGVINAPGGEILLAAGNSVELVNSLDPNLRVNITSPAGNVTNLGQLVADAGNLGLFGAVVKNSGSVSADSASLRGGKIVLKASQRVDAGGTISAKGVGGGEINVLSDMQSGTVRVSGTLDASAPVSGNGGLIETSAAFVNIADTARVSTLAANGKNGTWLIDPFDFTIAAAGGNITGATLSASLAAGNVIIQSTAGTTGVSGDVNVNDVVSWSVTQLTLNAQNNININANMNGSGTARLALEYGQQAVAAGNSSGYKLGSGVAVNLPAGNNFSTKLGSDGVVTTFTVITALGAEGSVTATDLQGINANLAGNYVLGGNIDASATSTWNTGLGFDPLGNSTTRFTGKFDGLGHTVTGLNINRPAQVDVVGLFGYVGVGGVVSNVGLLTPVITGSSTVGGLVGFNEGAVSNSYVSGGVVNAAWYTAGGLVGENTGTVSNSYVSGGSVHSNNWNAGGLVGRNTSGSISGSYVSGVAVSGSSSDVGGLAGLNAAGATITNSYVTGGSVHAAWSSAGGLVGDNQGAISNSYVSGGTVSSVKWNTGGLVGGNKATGTINTSFVLNTTISNSTGTSNAGGLVGRNAGAISNSYVNGGTVSGGVTVGGLVGWNATGASITNSYANTGAVSGGSLVGGLVGGNAGTVTNSYWNMTSSGLTTSAGGVGLTSAQMLLQSSFTGFDFTNTWRIYAGSTAPLLKAFLTPLTVSVSGSRAYNGLTDVSSLVVYSLTPSANLLGTAAANTASQNVGTYTVTPTGLYSNQFGYDISYAAASVNITAAPLAITANAHSKVYGSADPTLTYAITGGSLFNSDVLTGSLSRAAGETVVGGPYAIGQGTLGNGNYAITYTPDNLTITPAPLTFHATPSTMVYGGVVPSASYTVSGFVNSEVLGTSDVTGTPTLVITADSTSPVGGGYSVGIGTGTLASGNYSITVAGAGFSVTPAPLTVTMDALSKTYGNADPSLTYTITAGALLNGDTLSGTMTRVAGENVGNYAANGGLSNGNYTISYGGALAITPRGITLTANAQSKQYGTADLLLTYSIGGAGLATGDTAGAVFSGALARAAGETVAGGPYAINQGTLAANSNYAVTAFTPDNFTITTAPLSITASALSKIYGNADPTLTYSITAGALLNGDVLAGALSRAAGETVAGGPYAIGQGTLANGNYTITYTSNNFTITPRNITLAANAQSKQYGLADPLLTYTIGGLGLATGDTAGAVFSGALARAAGETVAGGPYAINQGTLAANSNYAVTAYAANDLTVTPAPLTVTMDALSKIYGNVDPSLTYTVTAGALLNGDTLSGTMTRVAGENVGSYAANGGLSNGNYTISYGGTLAITPRSISIAADVSRKVYGNADALTYTVGGMGLAAWDTQATSFTGALGRAAGEAVAGGPYAINQGSLVAGGNYTVTGFTTANLTITPALLSVLANAGNKVEGDVDPLLSYMVAGLKLNDTAATTLGGALDRAVGETVGTYAINQGTLTLLSTNYTMSFTPSMFTIQAPIRITTAQVNNLFNTILPPAPPPSALPPSAASATPAQPDTQAQPDPQVPAEVNAVAPVAGETAAPRQLPVCQ